jgi:hypothetical protein
MAKRKTPAMSEKEVLKHYTAYEAAPLSVTPGADAQTVLDRIPTSKPTFIKATIAVDHVLTGRRSAVIRNSETKVKTRRGRKHGKTKNK